MDDAPNENTGVATVPFTVTVWFADFGPLQPVAVAVITVVPNQVGE